jgi:hypothetical protein
MTLTEAVLSVVKEMEAEADGEDREEYSHTSAALHRYARKLRSVFSCSDKTIEREKQVICSDDAGDMPDDLLTKGG